MDVDAPSGSELAGHFEASPSWHLPGRGNLTNTTVTNILRPRADISASNGLANVPSFPGSCKPQKPPAPGATLPQFRRWTVAPTGRSPGRHSAKEGFAAS